MDTYETWVLGYEVGMIFYGINYVLGLFVDRDAVLTIKKYLYFKTTIISSDDRWGQKDFCLDMMDIIII